MDTADMTTLLMWRRYYRESGDNPELLEQVEDELRARGVQL